MRPSCAESSGPDTPETAARVGAAGLYAYPVPLHFSQGGLLGASWVSGWIWRPVWVTRFRRDPSVAPRTEARDTCRNCSFGLGRAGVPMEAARKVPNPRWPAQVATRRREGGSSPPGGSPGTFDPRAPGCSGASDAGGLRLCERNPRWGARPYSVRGAPHP